MDPYRFLLIEDHDDLRTMLADLLTMHGHQCELASSFDEALTMIDKVRPQIVLVEWALTRERRPQIVEDLRERARTAGIDVLVIAMSGADSSELTGTTPDAYVMKPFSADEILHVLRRGLAS